MNLLFKIYKRIHFYLGNIYRLLTLNKFQKIISPNEARTIFGVSFDKHGCHHIIKTLEEYDQNPKIDYRETTLFSFLKNFTPNSICDLIEITEKHSDLDLFVYPWGTFSKGKNDTKKNPYLSRFCGPSNDEFIKEEFNRTIKLYKEIKISGYRPWKYGNTFIGGTFLIKKNGDARFITLQGNHRMAILSHLNYEKIPVREIRGHFVNIFEKDLHEWELVKSRKCPVDVAKAIFSLYFKENGVQINNLKRI